MRLVAYMCAGLFGVLTVAQLAMGNWGWAAMDGAMTGLFVCLIRTQPRGAR